MLIPMLMIIGMISGCDSRVVKVATEAADRQAAQNQSMAELQKEIAAGTHGLVAADAESRKEAVAVHRDLAAERARLDDGWANLEQERQTIASQRRFESLLAPAIHAGGLLILVAALLGFCWYVLFGARYSSPNDVEISDLLLKDLFSKEPETLPGLTQASPPCKRLEELPPD